MSQETKNLDNPKSKGKTFKEILAERIGKNFNEISEVDVENYFKSEGFTRGQVNKLKKGFRQVRDSGNKFTFNDKGGFNVYNSAGTRLSGSGRSKGSKEGFDAGELIGLGRNVSLLGGVLNKTPYNPNKGKAAADLSKLKEGGLLTRKFSPSMDDAIADTIKDMFELDFDASTSRGGGGGKDGNEGNQSNQGTYVKAPEEEEKVYEVPSLLEQARSQPLKITQSKITEAIKQEEAKLGRDLTDDELDNIMASLVIDPNAPEYIGGSPGGPSFNIFGLDIQPFAPVASGTGLIKTGGKGLVGKLGKGTYKSVTGKGSALKTGKNESSMIGKIFTTDKSYPNLAGTNIYKRVGDNIKSAGGTKKIIKNEADLLAGAIKDAYRFSKKGLQRGLRSTKDDLQQIIKEISGI